MIGKVDTQTLESIHRLNNGSKDWRLVIASIEKDRDSLVQKLRDTKDEVELRLYQGQLQWVDYFLKTTHDASTTLHKRKRLK